MNLLEHQKLAALDYAMRHMTPMTDPNTILAAAEKYAAYLYGGAQKTRKTRAKAKKNGSVGRPKKKRKYVKKDAAYWAKKDG